MERKDKTNPCPVVILTGFLGSGKTTAINRWLHLDDVPKIGVVVNEFGQVGIDGKLLKPGEVVELGGGCVCCATGSELWEAALVLVDQGCTRIFVETSGIAEPAVLIEQFIQLPFSIKQHFEVCNVACVVDAKHIATFVAKRQEALHQLQAATKVIVTKTDQLVDESMETVHRFLDQHGTTDDRIVMSDGVQHGEVRMSLDWVFASQGVALSKKQPLPHPQGQLQAIAWSTRRPLVRNRLETLLHALDEKILRAKGILFLAEMGGQHPVPVVMHVAGSQMEFKPYEGSSFSDSTVVLIGENMDEASIRLRLAACCLGNDPDGLASVK